MVAEEQFGVVEILRKNIVKMMIDFLGGKIVVHGNGVPIGIPLPLSNRKDIIVSQNQVGSTSNFKNTYSNSY